MKPAISDRVDITLSIRDFNPPPSPSRMVVCIVYENDTDREENWRCIGMTAPCPIRSSVIFNETFPYDYVFEKTQLIKVNICPYYVDKDYQHDQTETLATTVFKVDELIGSFGVQLRKPLLDGCPIATVVQMGMPNKLTFSNRGHLLIDATLPEKQQQPIVLQFVGRSLERKDLIWDETAAFFRIYRVEQDTEDEENVLLYESEEIKNHSHPAWSEFSLEMEEIADDRNRLLCIEVLYRDVDGSEGYIGKALTTYAKMKYGPGKDNTYKVVNESKKATKKNYDNSGFIEMTKFSEVSFYNFLDYIVSGTQLHYEIAVDFSEERGKEQDAAERCRDETLLQIGIRGLGCVLRDYTPNRLFPAFGFGARVPPLAEESDEFNMNFSYDPNCRGLDCVIEAFKVANNLTAPLDTARCAKIINTLVRRSEESGALGLHYHVAAIFTRGGPIDDWKDSLAALCSAAHHPISIIVVGVGVGGFSSFSKLVRKAREAQKETRVCVEFMELHRFVNPTRSLPANRSRIAEVALANIPSQILSFMHRNAVSAKPPIKVCRSPLPHSSGLVPDHPTQFTFDDECAMIENVMERRKSSMPGYASARAPSPYTPHKGDRRRSEGQYLNFNPDALRTRLGNLSVSQPQRSRSVMHSSRERRRREREEREMAKRTARWL